MAANDSGGNGGTDNRVDVGRDVNGAVILGDNNHVNWLQRAQRPDELTPREHVELRPRRRRRDTLLGRATELRALGDALEAGDVVQLWGPPGVGKSELLRHAAHELPHGPHGVLFLDAAGREPEDLAQDMFEACYDCRGYAPSRTELRLLLKDFEVTVYVDNAAYTAEQFTGLMNDAPKATFVFASRERTLLGEGTTLRLGGLDRTAATELLARELGRPVTALDERDTADTLYDTSQGRPLLLLRAAALPRLDASGELVLPRPGAVADLLPPLLDSLDGPSRTALGLLAALGDAELDPEHIGTLSGAPDASALCANLTGLGLAEETESSGYRIVADVVAELERRGGTDAVPVDRLWYHFTTWLARETTTPAQVARHTRALEAIAERAERDGRVDLAVDLLRAASPALGDSLRFGIWGRLLDQGLPAAQRAGDRQAEAYFQHQRGVRALLTGNRSLAGLLFAEAGVLWRLLGDTHGVNAAAASQPYVPPQPTPTVPHTDGGAGQTLTNGSGADPSGGAHHATSSGADPSSAAHHATSPGADPSSAAHHVTSSGVDPGPAAHTVAPAPDPGTAASHATGVTPDPSTAVHHTFAAPPPGVHEAGVAAHSAVVTAPGAAGGAAALKVAAVIAALVIGGVAVDRYQEEHSSPSASTVFDTPTPDTYDDTGADPADTDPYEEEPTPEPTGLAGVWSSSEGGTYQWVDTGYGSYTAQWEDNCGETQTTEYTGDGDTYSATQPLYDADNNACGAAPLGEVLITVTLGPGSDEADLSIELSSGADRVSDCYDCGTFTLTRES